MSCVVVGSKVPLSLQLYDNKSGLKVTADILDMFGVKLTQMHLHSTESGLYINTDYPMPELPYILVSYAVDNSNEYESCFERFYSVAAEPEEETWIVGSVDNVSKDNEWITGVVE